MFDQLLALAGVLALATFYVVAKVKAWADLNQTIFQKWLDQWFVGAKVEIGTLVVGAVCGLAVKGIILAGGLSRLTGWGLPLSGFESIALWGYVVAGAASGFVSAIGVKLLQKDTIGPPVPPPPPPK